MQFVYHPEAGSPWLKVEGEIYNYIFKVRRHRQNETIALRNLQDDYIYRYQIEEVSRREADLRLLDKEFLPIHPRRYFHLLWCIIDPKSIEKILPSLNELGVAKISFVYCARSQKNFKIRLDKLQKILINSSQQCGRSRLMELEVVASFDEALRKYEEIVFIDFCEEKIGCADNIQRAFVGCEGGFSNEEKEKMEKVISFDTPLILRSETAAVAVASKVLV